VQINIFGTFLDIRENVEWPRFYWPTRYKQALYYTDAAFTEFSIFERIFPMRLSNPIYGFRDTEAVTLYTVSR